MSASTVDGVEDKGCSWDQVPIEGVFIYRDVFWMKFSAEDILQVRPTSKGGWMGYGKTFKYKPSWGISFSKVGVEESAEALRKNMYCVETTRTTLAFWASVTLLGLICVTWWLLEWLR